jgi:hypothetical protein
MMTATAVDGSVPKLAHLLRLLGDSTQSRIEPARITVGVPDAAPPEI